MANIVWKKWQGKIVTETVGLRPFNRSTYQATSDQLTIPLNKSPYIKTFKINGVLFSHHRIFSTFEHHRSMVSFSNHFKKLSQTETTNFPQIFG